MNPESSPRRLQALPSWLLAQAAGRARVAVTQALAPPASMARSRFAALACLDEFGTLSQAELGARIDLDRSDVVRLVDDLASNGWVVRGVDPSDRRRNILELTKKGARHLGDLDEKVGRAQDDVLMGLTPAERMQLVGLLQKMLAVGDS